MYENLFLFLGLFLFAALALTTIVVQISRFHDRTLAQLTESQRILVRRPLVVGGRLEWRHIVLTILAVFLLFKLVARGAYWSDWLYDVSFAALIILYFPVEFLKFKSEGLPAAAVRRIVLYHLSILLVFVSLIIALQFVS